MQHKQVKKPMVLFSLFFSFFLAAFVNTAKAGLDYYEIYLGKKLLLKRYVNQPLSLEKLPVSDASADDQLVIHYYQCNAPGKLGAGRRIALQDDNGSTIKEWRYADGQGAKTGMAIPIKELLQWEKKSKGALSLVYTAEGKKEGEKLAYLLVGDKSVTHLYRKPQSVMADLFLL